MATRKVYEDEVGVFIKFDGRICRPFPYTQNITRNGKRISYLLGQSPYWINGRFVVSGEKETEVVCGQKVHVQDLLYTPNCIVNGSEVWTFHEMY